MRRARRVLGFALLATFMGAGRASAQVVEESWSRGFFDEVRLGYLAHHIEPAGTERGSDLNFEVLLNRPGVIFANSFVDIVFRPRLHFGASINLGGKTSQAYTGLAWTVPLMEHLSLELTFGGALHDGPDSGPGSAFGCPLNFRESASMAFAVTERWRVYGTVAHMSNGSLCVRNSGLTSAGVRLGYLLN